MDLYLRSFYVSTTPSSLNSPAASPPNAKRAALFTAAVSVFLSAVNIVPSPPGGSQPRQAGQTVCYCTRQSFPTGSQYDVIDSSVYCFPLRRLSIMSRWYQTWIGCSLMFKNEITMIKNQELSAESTFVVFIEKENNYLRNGQILTPQRWCIQT